MEVFRASPFRARMEAHGEDSDGLDYESPVELEQATRAVAASGSPSRQILRDAPKAVSDRAPRGKHKCPSEAMKAVVTKPHLFRYGSVSLRAAAARVGRLWRRLAPRALLIFQATAHQHDRLNASLQRTSCISKYQ